MIRRTPTRIELKLDDISEYEQIKREVEAKRAMAKHNLLGSSPINTVQADAAPPPTKLDLATTLEQIHDRIAMTQHQKCSITCFRLAEWLARPP